MRWKTSHLIPIGILAILLFSCTNNEKIPPSEKFTIPIIINSNQHPSPIFKTFQEEKITYARPLLFGKYSFGETVDLNKKYIDENVEMTDENRDSIVYSSGYFRMGDDIRFKVYDTVDMNGIDIIPNYNQDIYFKADYGSPDSILYCHYPVYLVNFSQSPKLIVGNGGSTYGIQEAYDTTKGLNDWFVIERNGFFGCANGGFAMLLKPKEFVVVLVRKYKGAVKTKMRLRFKMKENFFVSRYFEGEINPKQFDLKDSFLLKDLSNADIRLRIFANEFYLGDVKTYTEQEILYYKKNKNKTSQK